nr:cytochrome P450 [Candidatus Microthrix sp.]
MSITDDGTPRFSADMITGMFISMMFAGHHTTSGTAAWTLIELLRHPGEMAKVVAELDELYADGTEVSFQALREMPQLEGAIKEALRLHPPLILLLRVSNIDLEVGGCHVAPGKMVAASPAISNRIPEAFEDPDEFRPGRYLTDPGADVANPWNWIPFGAGRHRCVGANFAMMQLKAIFSVLLKDWTLKAAQPLDSYRNDHSKMVVQLAQPCLATYERRGPTTATAATERSGRDVTSADADAAGPVQRSTRADGWRIAVDRDLCQGHATCQGEAPELFEVSKRGELTILDERPPDEARAAADAAVKYCPTHLHSQSKKTRPRRIPNDRLSPRRARRDGRALASGQPGRRGVGRLAKPGRLLHRGCHLRLELRSQGALHGRRPRRDPRHCAGPGDGRPRRVAVSVRGADHRRDQGPCRWVLASGGRRHPG